MARVLWAVMDGLVGDDALLPPGRGDHATRIRIAIKPREDARRNLDPDPVAGLEEIACRPEIDLEQIHLTRRHQLLPVRAIPIPGADDTVRQVVDAAARTNVDQLGGEIGVDRTR